MPGRIGPSTAKFFPAARLRPSNGRRIHGSARRPGRCVSQVPAPRPIPRGGGADEACRLSRLGVLGPPRPGIWGSPSETPNPRPGARGPRRESDWARVHGGPERRVAVSRPPPGRICQPAHLGLSGRWTRTPRLLHRRRGPVCASREQAHARGVRAVSALLGGGDATPQQPARRDRPRRRGLPDVPRGVERRGPQHPIAAAAVPARRGLAPSVDRPDCIVPSEPAEHADGVAQGIVVRRGVPGRPAPARRGPRKRRGKARRSTLNKVASAKRGKRLLQARRLSDSMAGPRRVVILGAAGRDFHNFNVLYRDNPAYKVIAFTATQIPGIEGRKYPASLAGRLYPDGIPIFPEEDLPDLVRKHAVQSCVFSYSDVDYAYIGHRIALATANGADFTLLGAQATMLKAQVPVIAICAVRTGSGKSQTTRRVAEILRAHGKKVVVVRHPMPYGDLAAQAVERFATYEDLDRYETTIEEREEYEPHIDKGTVVYAGVDYEKILRQAEREAEVLLWDGGNNDTPFFQPDLHIVDADPPITADESALIRGKRVLAIEDGPTLTHGGMEYGAAYLAAQRFGASDIVSAVGHAVGSIKETYRKYPNSHKVLPAMGYGPKQIKELEETIDATPCDVVVSGTPIDLSRVLKSKKPVVHVRYELDEIGHPNLEDVLRDWEFI